MEDIHGVDVSWLHHSHKDKVVHRLVASPPPKPPSTNRAESAPPKLPQTTKPRGPADDAPSKPQPIPSNTVDANSGIQPPLQTPPTAASNNPLKRPGGLLNRGSREKLDRPPGQIETTRSTPRRSSSSWISSISSKLSQPSPQSQAAARQPVGTPAAPAPPQPNPYNNQVPSPAPSSEKKPHVPQQPKTGSSSFFSNALRRLSSSSQLGQGPKPTANVGVCPRMVLNVDPRRPRCLLPELNPSKLRRVAFCVDVEIAGGPKYKDEQDAGEKQKMAKDRKLKEKAEGDALRNPGAMAEEKDRIDPDGTKPEQPPVAEDDSVEKKDASRKKEKKKRSEEGRKERKEQKRREAEENGTVPLQFSRDSDEDAVPSPDESKTPPRPFDKPTTDPLRIYRRCCQLRESPVLKRITEQLGNSANCPLSTPGVVMSLNLTGSRLQLSDYVSLSDWLAVVPVTKLILEDSALTDEAVRVVLAGLLAAKLPSFSKRKSGSNKSPPAEVGTGVIEKLSLKNNPKITKDGWKYTSLFIHMSKSLKSLDVSMNPFPASEFPSAENGQPMCPDPEMAPSTDPGEIFAKSISERLGGARLEELIMGECSLSTHHIRKIVDAVTISGLKRLGLAGNSIDDEGLKHVCHFVRSGVCQGLDLGSNYDLKNHLDILSDAFHENCPLWALSLADCGLEPDSLSSLFPGLLNLPNLRFLDLSHNSDLFTPDPFSEKPSALGLLRKYIPLLPELKRIHLNNVDMMPAQAIGLAEILPECPQLAHLNILGNQQLSALASATDEETQEEACALYASLMAAARVSRSIICIDIDVPSSDNSEVVKALAKQVVAYCLRNVEQMYPIDPTADLGEIPPPQVKEIDVPEVLLHLVGHDEGRHAPVGDDPAPDKDYIVGGTGVVKALSYCLSEKAADLRRSSWATSGTDTPRSHLHPPDIGATRARNMSKHLLESARKIRERLQPVMVRESRGTDDMAFRRLLFLDNTLRRMIERFEDEYPECRLPASEAEGHVNMSASTDAIVSGSSSSISTSSPARSYSTATHPHSIGQSTMTSAFDADSSDDEDDVSPEPSLTRSRHASDVSLASKALSIEEGRVHRIGQNLKRDILAEGNGWPADDRIDDELREKLALLNTGNDSEQQRTKVEH